MDHMSDMERYHRQMLLPGIGEAGQRRLLAGRAVIVGCGALGTVAAELLVRAGVGTVTIVDRDVVELTNLQRQVLFDEADARAGLPKAEAARAKLQAINSQVHVEAVVADLEARGAEKLIGRVVGMGGRARRVSLPPAPSQREGELDAAPSQPPEGEGESVLLDCTDNFETRYLLNDAAVKLGVPLVYAGAVGTVGMSMTVLPGEGPCLRCVFEEPPDAGSAPTCDTAGVLGPVTAMIASVQAAEAIKILAGQRGAVSRELVSVDLWGNSWRRMDLRTARRPECPCCGERRFEFLDGQRGSRAATLCGRGAVQVTPPTVEQRLDLVALATRLGPHATVEASRFLVKGTLWAERGENGEPLELTVFPDGRAIVKGTTELDRARGIYAKYVGA